VRPPWYFLAESPHTHCAYAEAIFDPSHPPLQCRACGREIALAPIFASALVYLHRAGRGWFSDRSIIVYCPCNGHLAMHVGFRRGEALGLPSRAEVELWNDKWGPRPAAQPPSG
jgi:hypothetical protein